MISEYKLSSDTKNLQIVRQIPDISINPSNSWTLKYAYTFTKKS